MLEPEAAEATPSQSGLPDPFLLPSPTGYRFALLIATVVSVTCIIYVMLYNSVPSHWERRAAASAKCQALPDPMGQYGIPDAIAGGVIRGRCMAPENRAQGLWLLVGVALLGGVTFGLYWSAAARKIRKDQLEPLTTDDAPEAVSAIVDLCREVELHDSPRFMWLPTNNAVSGVAFGRRGRYYVALTGGLVGLLHTDPSAFRAIVLHELAHVRNRDIDKTHLTVASWQAFVLVALVPLVVSWLIVPPRNPPGVGWRIGAMALLILLTRNELLRTREFYADLRAVQWESKKSALPRVLGRLRVPAARSRAMALWDFHPTGQQRQSIIMDPRPLLRPEFAMAVLTGATATVAIREGTVLFNAFFVFRTPAWLSPLAPDLLPVCIVFASLASFVVGSDLWEAQLLAVSSGMRPLGGLRMGFGLGLGMLAGFKLSIVASATGALGYSVLGVACWVALLPLVCVALTKGFADAVHAWLSLGGQRRFLNRARAVSLVLYAGLLSLWLATFAWAQLSITAPETSTQPLMPLFATGFVLLIGLAPTLTLFVLGMVPFLVRRGTTHQAGTADAVASRRPTEGVAAVLPGRALFLGLAAGILPVLIGYLRHGLVGVIEDVMPSSVIAPMGLSLQLTVLVTAAAVFVARKARAVAWLQAVTCGVGAGAMTCVAIAGLSANLHQKMGADARSFTFIAWFALGVGLLVSRKRSLKNASVAAAAGHRVSP